MHFTYSELKEIHDGLISLFSKKDNDIDALEGSPSADDIVVIMHNNVNKKTTVGTLVGHDTPLATVATTGSYTDLINTPTIPAAQVNADWNASSGTAQILNKPTIPAAQVNSDWDSDNGVSKILHRPEVRPSFIPYDNNIDNTYLEQHSYLNSNLKFSEIVHTVILEAPTTFTNYDLTSIISYYTSLLEGKQPSKVSIEFISYNASDSTTFIITNINKNLYLYGKFSQITTDKYMIASPTGVKTRCRIEIMNFKENDEDVFYITCERLGNYVATVNNE